MTINVNCNKFIFDYSCILVKFFAQNLGTCNRHRVTRKNRDDGYGAGPKVITQKRILARQDEVHDRVRQLNKTNPTFESLKLFDTKQNSKS